MERAGRDQSGARTGSGSEESIVSAEPGSHKEHFGNERGFSVVERSRTRWSIARGVRAGPAGLNLNGKLGENHPLVLRGAP